MSVELLRKQIARKYIHSEILRKPESLDRFKFGVDFLDTLFERDLPCGQLIELTGHASSGKRTLLFEILGRITANSQVLLIDTGSSFFAPAAEAQQVRLTNLLVCTPEDAWQGIITVERLLRQGVVKYAVIDLTGYSQPLRETLLHRLRIETVRNRGMVFFLTDLHRSLFPPSLMSLRLAVHRKDADLCEVAVTKSRVSPEGMRREFSCHGISQGRLHSY